MSTESPLQIQDRETVLAQSEEAEWNYLGKPDYTRHSEIYDRERKCHPDDSLADIARNLARTFEMETSYKANPDEWVSVATDTFWMSTNGGPAYTVRDIVAMGSYNVFIEETQHYSAQEETSQSATKLFHTAFPGGLVWEVVEVLSGPPNVAFKWRHWGTFAGPYKDHPPTGETVELYGMAIARVNEELKLESAEFYFDNSQFFDQLTINPPTSR
ncbi:MAG: SnoaL-like polyketide cyclase [Candidatus Tectomicrobia bacterium]|nr:SnoaL-like polyketide cyclase [Candidatus Tectomicrobia bacterium]